MNSVSQSPCLRGARHVSTVKEQRNNSCVSCLAQGVNQDIHKVDKSTTVLAIQENCEQFDPRTENLFRYLQVRTVIHNLVCALFKTSHTVQNITELFLAELWLRS